ncbi:MAG: TOBE domain-containing protein [Syntrophobacteraceae bacterium]
MEGTVEEVVYLGEASKYFVRLSGEVGGREHPVVMKAQNRNGASMRCRGDRLRIGWDERDAVLVWDHFSERGGSK